MDVHAFDFVEQPIPPDRAPVVVLFGEDGFLHGLALKHLQADLAGDDEDSAISEWEGRSCQWRDVANEVRTVSLFGGGIRCAIIRQADEFVSANRDLIEKYVANPAKSGCLILQVKSWPRNTRLAKAVLKTGVTVECRPPQRKAGKKTSTDQRRLVDWMIKRAAAHHQTKLSRPAAQQLLDLTGEHLGLIDQELAKLSLYTDGKSEMKPADVLTIVGGWKTQTTWDLLDAICDGNASEALAQLDRLLVSGEHPQALFGAFSWTLRRYAIATRYVEVQRQAGRNPNLQQALVAAGIHKFQAGNAERRLRQIGRVRAGRLLEWLVQADAQLKGSHSSPERARFVLEELIFRLSQQTDPKHASV